MRSAVEHLQRERNNLSSQLASLQEELRDREGQLKNLETDCFQGYIPELEKLRRANQDANLRIAALVKLVQGHEEHLTEQDKSALATIPLFPSLSQKGVSTSGLAKTHTRLSHAGTSGQPGLLPPLTFDQSGVAGGTVSPNFSGSAFHLIGSSSTPAGALTSGGINVPMQSTDSILLGRMLHEKETMLQQQLQDLTRLRFQNSEMEVRIKSLQRELDNKTTRLTALEAAQAAAGVGGLVDWQSHTSGMPISQAELTTLRQANTEMRGKLMQLQTSLQERKNELIRVQNSQSTANTLEIERLKLELTKLKDERESIEQTLRAETARAADELARMNTTASVAETELQEKKDKIRLLEFEKIKINSDLEDLQKKYHNVLGQVTEKTEKLQQMERDCESNHIHEIQRLTKESDELNHRVTYLHKTLQDREGKLEQQETELSRQKEENVNAKMKIHSIETEIKSLREEITFKDERSKQLQVQHADEISRMRLVQQEQGSQISHLQLTIDEKEHELKSLSGDLTKAKSDLEYTKNRLQEIEVERCQINNELVEKTDKLRTLELESHGQADELSRLQVSLEDNKSKVSILQKRVEEREQRLRKVEGENHDLLDEIHGLRKRNHELESHSDVLRQRLLQRGEQSIPPVTSSPSSRFLQNAEEKPSAKLTLEAENLRKRNTELENELVTLRRRMQELQIQVDQLNYERENLNKSYDEELKKRVRLENLVAAKPVVAEPSQKSSEDVDKLKLMVNQLKLEVEQKESQIHQLTQRLSQAEKIYSMSSVSDSDKDAIVSELKLSLQRTQQALDAANNQNKILQARTESTLLECRQQHLVQQQSLQEQLSELQQNLSELNSRNERLQREVRQSSGRIQELTRQLRETQANCDSIASQRDNLQSRLEQIQHSGGGMSSYSTGSGILGRPASVAAGYSDLLLPLSGVTSGGQLSRELDRLHREQDVTRGQLDAAEKAARQFKQEAETAKREVAQLKEELQHQSDLLHEMEENLQNCEKEATRKATAEMENYRRQHDDLTKQLENLRKQVTAKDSLIEQLTSQLNATEEKYKELEQRTSELNQQIESLKSQQDQVAFERNQQQRLSYELETVKKELSIRENQFNQLTQKLNQSLKDANDQSQVIEELSRQLKAAKLAAQQAEQEVDNARRNSAAWANEQMQAQQQRLQAVSSEQTQRDREVIASLKSDLQAALNAKETAEQRAAKLEDDFRNQIKALDAKMTRAQAAEEVCKQEHLAIIEKLSQENQDLKSALDEVRQTQSRPQKFDEPANHSLKQEVDILKKELDKRDTVITKLEKECQEKHVRKLEALQVQLRRLEEENADLNRVLDEQRNGIEERDRLVRQLRAEGQKVGGGAELEKLQAEHSRCGQQIQQKQQQLETLMKQLEQQAEEILTTKIEALTASLCEKDANIALIQTTGPKNSGSNQALQKLTAEKETIQTQLRQLTFARDALAEQRKT
uniref:GRIP domain-containing protein n=1 Tax=Mesocestoides corti TaxID=53468 RepID=A0A5K3EGV4_MESCO